jgi:hypothetical protein
MLCLPNAKAAVCPDFCPPKSESVTLLDECFIRIENTHRQHPAQCRPRTLGTHHRLLRPRHIPRHQASLQSLQLDVGAWGGSDVARAPVGPGCRCRECRGLHWLHKRLHQCLQSHFQTLIVKLLQVLALVGADVLQGMGLAEVP